MESVFANYAGDKVKMTIDGTHNTTRATHIYQTIATYFNRCQVSVKTKSIPMVKRLPTEWVDDEGEEGDETSRCRLPKMNSTARLLLAKKS
jgi:hypothetical protein